MLALRPPPGIAKTSVASLQSAAAQVIKATSPAHGSRLGPPITPSPFSSANQYAIDLAETVFSPEDDDLSVAAARAAAPAPAFAAALADAVRACMHRGDLVPDELVHAALNARLHAADCAERGWILDGYPRTPEQAVALLTSPDPNMVPELVVELHLDDDEAMRRIAGRAASASVRGSAFAPSPSGIAPPPIASPSTGTLHTSRFGPGCNDGADRSSVVARKESQTTRDPKFEDESREDAAPRMDDMNPAAILQRLQDYDRHRNGIVDVLGQAARVEVVHTDASMTKEEIATKVGGIVGDARRIVLMGKAGSGKSVQGNILMQGMDGQGPVHVSTGSILRKWTAMETGFADVATMQRQQLQQRPPQRSMLM